MAISSLSNTLIHSCKIYICRLYRNYKKIIKKLQGEVGIAKERFFFSGLIWSCQTANKGNNLGVQRQKILHKDRAAHSKTSGKHSFDQNEICLKWLFPQTFAPWYIFVKYIISLRYICRLIYLRCDIYPNIYVGGLGQANPLRLSQSAAGTSWIYSSVRNG